MIEFDHIQGLGNEFDGYVEQQNGFNPLDCLLVSRRKFVYIISEVANIWPLDT